MSIYGESILGFRIFDFLVQLSCLPLIFYLAKRVSGLGMAGFLASAFYGIFYFQLKAQGTAEKESYVIWALLLCTALSFSINRRRLLRALLAGLLLGFIFVVKPNYGLYWPVFGLLFLAQGLHNGFRKTMEELLLFSACCCLPAILLVLYYWRLGALAQLYRDAIWFNAKIYTQMIPPAVIRRRFWIYIVPIVIFKSYPLYFFPMLVALGLQFKKRTFAKDQCLFWTLLALLIIGIIGYEVQGKFFPYQLATFVPLVMIFAAWAFAWIFGALGDVSRGWYGRVAVWLLLAGLILFAAGGDGASRDFALKYCYRDFDRAYLAGLGTKDDTLSAANLYLAAQYLKPLVNEKDGIALVGGYPLIPFLLKKKLPTPFMYTHQLLMLRWDGEILPEQKQWMREYSAQIISAKPRFIIVTENFGVERDPSFNFMTKDIWSALDNQFPELKAFMDRNYQLRKKIGKVHIFEMAKKDGA
jgi:hypothetical protein